MYKLAFKNSSPISFSYFIVSFAFGMSCVNSGLAVWVPVAMSIFVYGGTSQFVLLALFLNGASVFTIVMSIFFVNLRYMLMSIYMGNHFRELNFKSLHKLIYGTQITDESFAFHSLDTETNLKNHYYYISFHMTCHIFWIMGSLTGALFLKYYNNIINIRLDYALTALMIYTVVILTNSKLKVIIVILSIVIGTILRFTINTSIDIFIVTFITTGIAIWLKKKI